jgi:hypothetical protein
MRAGEAAGGVPTADSVVHAASILVVPVACVALLLLYCASGGDRWSKPQSGETRPLVRASERHPNRCVCQRGHPGAARNPGAAWVRARNLLTWRVGPQSAKFSKSAVTLPSESNAEAGGVSVAVKPNSWALRSTGW